MADNPPVKRTERFSPAEILVAETELIRCLLLLLMAKGLVSEAEIMVMADFAKKRLLSPQHDSQFGPGAARYLDHLLRTLQPDAPTPRKEQQ